MRYAAVAAGLLAAALMAASGIAVAQTADWDGGYVQPKITNETADSANITTELTEAHYTQALAVVIIFIALAAFILIVRR